MKDRLLKERCLRLKLILTDVDGVMTDGSIFVLPDGGEARVFNVKDGYGIFLAHAAGIETGLITGRSSVTVEKRAAALGMTVEVSGRMSATVELDMQGQKTSSKMTVATGKKLLEIKDTK